MKNSVSSVSSISSLITSSDTAPVVPTEYPIFWNPPPQKQDSRILGSYSSRCLPEADLNCRSISAGLCFEPVCINKCTWSSWSVVSNARIFCPKWSAVSLNDSLTFIFPSSTSRTGCRYLGHHIKLDGSESNYQTHKTQPQVRLVRLSGSGRVSRPPSSDSLAKQGLLVHG